MRWPVVPLADVAEIQGGIQKQPKRTPRDNPYPFLRVANVTARGLDLDDVHSIELFDGELERYRLRPGDLLVVEGNGSASQIGRAAVWDGSIKDAVHQNHLIRVRPGPQCDSRFLGHVWNSPTIRTELTQVSSSTSGLHTLSVAKLKRITVPVPPLDEQRRIVNLLEDHLSRLDASDLLLSNSRKRLTRMRQSILAESMRRVAEDQAVSLGELATVATGTTPLKSNEAYYEGGTIPWVTSGDLHQGVIRQASQFVTEQAVAETSLRLFPAGSILLAMYGEGKTRGTAAELEIAATVNQACAAVVLNDPALKSWIRLVLDANYLAMRRMAAGGVQPNLNLSLVRAIQVPLPPETIRNATISRVAEVEISATEFENALAVNTVRARNLRRSLLSAAFSGRLTRGRQHLDTEELVSP